MNQLSSDIQTKNKAMDDLLMLLLAVAGVYSDVNLTHIKFSIYLCVYFYEKAKLTENNLLQYFSVIN